MIEYTKRKGEFMIKIEHEDLKQLEYKLKSGSNAIGKKLMDLQIPRGALAVAIFRGEDVIIPSGQTILFKEDKIIKVRRYTESPKFPTPSGLLEKF